MRFSNLSLIVTLLVLTACTNNQILPQAGSPASAAATPAARSGAAPGTGPSAAAPVAGAITGADTPASPPAVVGTAAASPAATPVDAAMVAAAVPTPAAALATAPAPAPSATVSPTITPAITATATAVVPPDQLLQAGRGRQEVGDCDSARRDFAGVVEAAAGSAVPAAALSEARYRLAECYLRDDAAGEAALVLSDLLAAAPAGDAYRGPATYLLGEAQAAQQLWDDAVASYTRYLDLAPDLAAWTWQRIAAVRVSAGNLAGAAEAYGNALPLSPDLDTTVAIRQALAGVLVRQGNSQAAVAQYDLLRGDQTHTPWAAQMQWLAGSALQQAGDLAGASARWQAAALADPTSSYAHKAVAALVDANVPVDEFTRGMVDYYNGLDSLALQAFTRLRAVDPTGHNGDAWYYAALSYLALDEYEPALAELGNFIAAYPQSALLNDAWLARGRAQGRSGDRAGAIATLRQFAAQQPNATQAPTALWQAAAWLAQDGNSPDVAQAYLDLARRYPAATEGWQAYLAAGLSYYRLGDYSRAGQAWTEMSQSPQLAAWTKPVAYYWLGKAQTAAGEAESARAAWQLAVQSGSDSYYGLRAADRLAGQGSAIFGPGVSNLPGEAGAAVDQEALAAWLSSWAGEGSLALSPAIQADPDWRRGQELLVINVRAAGVAAWTRLQKRLGNDPWQQAQLALAFRAAGEYPLSISAAERLAALAPAGTALPAALERLEYPLVLSPLIQAQATQWGVDPYLVAAVIRQESRFETVALSSAAAQGLMQIIPSTADWIADQLGRAAFAGHQIYWPYINVEFGTYYLHRQIEDFGSVATALAAYNGGPGNAIKWRNRAPNDEDLMVALIELPESRLYVQLVYQHYEAYRRLYTR